ncbi:MAG: M14 family zinc carboxypeptidase [Lachnospiraceae bacterium]
MRKNKIYAVGLGVILGITLPTMIAAAEPTTEIPALEAPADESQGQEPSLAPESEAKPEPSGEAEQALEGESATEPSGEAGQALEGESAAEPSGESETAPSEETTAPVSREDSGEIGPGQGMEEQSGGGTITNTSGDTNDYSKIGPGMSSSAPSDANGLTEVQEFLTMTVENPVVQITDKYSYEQMEADIQSLQKRYGTAHMQVTTIGTSADGRNIYDIIVGNPNAGKHVLIQGAIHAREYANPLLMMKQIEDALAFYDTGAYNGRRLSDLLNQVAVHFVPMANPDGVALSQFGLDALNTDELKQTVQTAYASDLAAGRTSYEFGRYLERWKANARGVDLNHNFDALWTNTSSNWMLPSYSGYKGLTPVSEPESQALVNLMNSDYPWAAVLNYHSMGKVIYWDIEGNKERERSRQLAQLMSAATGGYQMLYSGGGGGFKDWAQLKENPVPSITVETGKVDCPMPVSEFASIWAENRAGWALVADFVLMY